MMSSRTVRSLFLALLSLGLGLPAALPAQAGTCASECGPAPLSFTPGSPIEVEVVNLTANIILFEEAGGTDPIPLAPGRTLRLPRLTTTIENAALNFWDSLGLAVQARLTKSSASLLRVEILPEYDPPGQGALYLRDDGRVDVF
ncbi:MAG: hypothetical protein ACO3NK_00610 [Prochlorotrichaceae cyanobacterium]